jgi:serine/threonine protein kinase
MSDLCKKCGKPPLAEKAGSFTSYLFLHNYCQCDQKHDSLSSVAPKSTRPTPIQAENLSVCSRCGKALGAKERSGSFTSFLFKDLRCQCKSPVIAKPVAANPVLAGPLASKRTNTSYRSTHKSTRHDTRQQQLKESPSVSSNTSLKLGTIIGGTFKIESIIGSGGMGVVYAAEHTGLHRRFALKILSPELVNEQTWKRFQAEAKTLGALHHSTLVNVYDLGLHDHSLPYYSMELLEGRTLEQILIDDGPLYLDEAIEIFLQVLGGLAYAHRNDIIHRDLKPGNIMVCNVDGDTVVKILDFGISKFLQLGRQNQSLTMVGETFGSPYYMSPEQSIGADVDARSDIYSIGCSLFEALTSYVPFEGESQMEIVMMHEQDEPPLLAEVDPDTKFPDSIEYVVAKCLAKHPDDRYQSAKELAIDLERIKDNKYARSFFEGKKPFKSVSQRRSEIAASDTPRHSKRAIVVLSSVIVLAALTIATAIITYSGQVASSLTDRRKDDSKVNTTPTYYSQLSEDGSTIEFNFPEEQIGLIGTNRKMLGAVPASGKVQFPADKRLFFFTNRYSATHPEIIKSFRPDDLYGYILRYRFENKQQLKDTLAYLKQLTGLKRLEAPECDFGDEEVEDINAMSNLDWIDLKNTNLTPVGLKNFKILKQLNYIYYDFNKYITSLLETIAGSKQLDTLYISTPDKPITMDDAKLIKTLPNLTNLNIENTSATDEILMEIASMPNLQSINARGCKITKQGYEALTKKYGNRLKIAVNPAEFTQSIKQASGQKLQEFDEKK